MEIDIMFGFENDVEMILNLVMIQWINNKNHHIKENPNQIQVKIIIIHLKVIKVRLQLVYIAVNLTFLPK